jgi:type VI secretion system secreted protein VgrG
VAGNVDVQIASGDALDIRVFSVNDRVSTNFEITILALSLNPDIDFDAVIGQPASFHLVTPLGGATRTWTGICSHFQQVQVETTGASTYHITLVPTLWLLTQRRNHRMFQQLSELEIVLEVLTDWGITPVLQLDPGAHKKRKYRVQYGETDFSFISRMLEDAGITFYFEQAGEETKLVLNDAPQRSKARSTPLSFVDHPSPQSSVAYATGVKVTQQVRPGKYTIQDHDYRRPPTQKLLSSASGGLSPEAMLERFHYVPGSFLFHGQGGGDSPHADDRGAARSDEKEAALIAQKRLDAKRANAKRITFESNAFDLSAGVVVTFANHPRSDLGEGKKLLVLGCAIRGTSGGSWTLHGEAVSADNSYRPPLVTGKPKTEGVESATVVGPPGEEIHTDEFGRVRVQFHWDREGEWNEKSSCWIHVNQPWGGAGFGGTNLPRIGQEVLVDFLGGDPDRPVITGRVFTNLQKTPYKLPDNRTQSGLKSNSTGGGGGYNEMMFEDKKGQELVRMQAEKDRTTLVKNNESLTVGNNRHLFVRADNTETVTGNETIYVKDHRKIDVDDHQDLTVKHDITTTSTEGNQNFQTPKGNLVSNSVQASVHAKDYLELWCGTSSSIIMTPSMIIINAPEVLINPGAAAMQYALTTGKVPKSDSEIEAEQKAAAAKAAEEAQMRRNVEELNQIFREYNEKVEADRKYREDHDGTD